MALSVTETTGTPGLLDNSHIERFRARLRGTLLQVGDDGYDAARRVWNGMIDKHPALIARCTGPADVVEAVRFAHEHNLLISVRGGGHNVAGNAVCEGGLMIDLSHMTGIQVDPVRRTARVQGGATWGMLDRETQRFGLATPGGTVSTTGVAGLTLGGGYGSLRNKYGLSCDNLVAAEVVTATGEVLTASAKENSDLLWGLRGGGGNLGIVTAFEFQLHPVGPEVAFAAVVYPIDEAHEVLSQWRDYVATIPDEVSTAASFLVVPRMPGFPEELAGRSTVVVSGLFSGGATEGEPAVEPLRHLGTPLLDLSGRWPYVTTQSALDDLFPAGQLQHYWKATYVQSLGSDVIDDLIELAATRPSTRTLMTIWHHSGVLHRTDPSATAFWQRHVSYMADLYATWENPADAEPNIHWARNGWTKLRRHCDGGAYLNFPGLGEEGDALVRAAYGGNYERLVELKTKYDPTNFFRMNQNIRPRRS
jgi:FAD/FMN-containing dehydrogenase